MVKRRRCRRSTSGRKVSRDATKSVLSALGDLAKAYPELKGVASATLQDHGLAPGTGGRVVTFFGIVFFPAATA